MVQVAKTLRDVYHDHGFSPSKKSTNHVLISEGWFTAKCLGRRERGDDWRKYRFFYPMQGDEEPSPYPSYLNVGPCFQISWEKGGNFATGDFWISSEHTPVLFSVPLTTAPDPLYLACHLKLVKRNKIKCPLMGIVNSRMFLEKCPVGEVSGRGCVRRGCVRDSVIWGDFRMAFCLDGVIYGRLR